MIKIQSGKDGRRLTDLAEEHWNLLNPVGHNGKLLVDSLKFLVEKMATEHKLKRDINRAEFYEKLREGDFKLLKYIVTCPIENIPELILEITDVLTHLGLQDFKISEEGNFGNELLRDVFRYSLWRSDESVKSFFINCGLAVCPYCNHSLLTYDKTRDQLILQIDHFYDKARYPYLAMSYFNLIPTCQICNSAYKGRKEFTIDTHIHPYLDDYDTFIKFHSNYTPFANDYEIGIKYSDGSEKAKKITEDLGILERYSHNQIKKYSKTVFATSQRYPIETKHEMMAKYNMSLREIESKICNEEDVPFTKNQILNNCLGKLKRDLSIQYFINTTAL